MVKVTDDQPFKLKSGMASVMVMELTTTDLDAIEQHAATVVDKAKALLQNAPIVLALTAQTQVDVSGLRTRLATRNLHLVGVLAGNEAKQAEAAAAGIPVLHAGLSDIPAPPQPEAVAKSAQPKAVETQPATTAEPGVIDNRLITKPVRSGQQVYAKAGDLIVRDLVSAGAEIAARGNVHVYGPLRGRAFAGTDGNTQARIFCLCLEAEMISISGVYCLADELPKHVVGKSVEVRLQNDQLEFELL